MKNLSKIEQSGRSMVEMLGVLAIIGVLSIGGISGYSKAMSKYRVNKTLDQISMLVINIRTLYSSAISYKDLSNAVAVQMGIIPRDMLNTTIKDAGTGEVSIVNAYSGQVDIGIVENTNDRQFYIVYSGLPQEACVSIATADWGSQAGSGLQSVSISESATGKTKPTSFANTHAIDSLPLTLATAAGECKTEDVGNSIKWTYY